MLLTHTQKAEDIETRLVADLLPPCSVACCSGLNVALQQLCSKSIELLAASIKDGEGYKQKHCISFSIVSLSRMKNSERDSEYPGWNPG